jgi:hypothetical protein
VKPDDLGFTKEKEERKKMPSSRLADDITVKRLLPGDPYFACSNYISQLARQYYVYGLRTMGSTTISYGFH